MAIDKEKEILITNRSNGLVCYNVPDLNISRVFEYKETKKVSYEELRCLSQQAGGRELIYNFLYIPDSKVLEELLNVKEEPEYWLREADIPTWINSCSVDAFKDALSFAPQGIIDLIKKYAISLPVNSANKREAMKEMLNFDVDRAIENNKIANEDEEKKDTAAAEAITKRRTRPNYKVIETK